MEMAKGESVAVRRIFALFIESVASHAAKRSNGAELAQRDGDRCTFFGVSFTASVMMTEAENGNSLRAFCGAR